MEGAGHVAVKPSHTISDPAMRHLDLTTCRMGLFGLPCASAVSDYASMSLQDTHRPESRMLIARSLPCSHHCWRTRAGTRPAWGLVARARGLHLELTSLHRPSKAAVPRFACAASKRCPPSASDTSCILHLHPTSSPRSSLKSKHSNHTLNPSSPPSDSNKHRINCTHTFTRRAGSRQLDYALIAHFHAQSSIYQPQQRLYSINVSFNTFLLLVSNSNITSLEQRTFSNAQRRPAIGLREPSRHRAQGGRLYP